jgi:hypothetical protein
MNTTNADQLLAETHRLTEKVVRISADLKRAEAAVRAADAVILDLMDDKDDAERAHGLDSAEYAEVAARSVAARASYAEAEAEWKRLDDAHTAALKAADEMHAAYIDARGA